MDKGKKIAGCRFAIESSETMPGKYTFFIDDYGYAEMSPSELLSLADHIREYVKH